MRDDLIAEINTLAADFVNNDVALDTGLDLVFRIIEPKAEGILTNSEIAQIYSAEYNRLKASQTTDIGELIRPNIGWIVAIIIGIGAFFRDMLLKVITGVFSWIWEGIYSQLAGIKLFRWFALRRYEKRLTDAYEQLKISFRPARPLEMKRVYVPLKVKGTQDTEQVVDAFETIAQHPHVMITGAPGSGKSVLLKQIALTYARWGLSDVPGQPVVVLVELHRMNDPAKTVEQHLIDAFERHGFPRVGRFIQGRLNRENGLLLLFDGLDEVSSGERQRVAQQINDFCNQHNGCRVVITCRTAVYEGEFDALADRRLVIVEFSDQQIRRFLEAWKQDMPPAKSVEQLMNTLQEQPPIRRLAGNPLLLTIIAYLYTDTNHVLPQSRAEFYQVATDVLLRQWHNERNEYKAPEKRLVLQHLALFNQVQGEEYGQDRRTIPYTTVLDQIKQVMPSLNLDDQLAKPLLDEIVDRSGLLLKIDGGQNYQFAHRTLQEFFAAEKLVNNTDVLFQCYQLDPVDWGETAKLWCGLSEDSTNLISRIYNIDAITAFQCLGEALKVDPELSDRIINQFKTDFEGGDEAVIGAFASVASDMRPRGQSVFDWLVNSLEQNTDSGIQRSAALALSQTNLPSAAQALASFYVHDAYPIYRDALLRMGDLAVPALQTMAVDKVQTVYGLGQIGTPRAAEALVHLLWHPAPIVAAAAAWRLGDMLRRPEIEAHLGVYPLNPAWQRANDYEWIWQPFETPETRLLRPIVGRIAYWISQSDDPLGEPTAVELDPRIGVPLWATNRDYLNDLKEYQWAQLYEDRVTGRTFTTADIFAPVGQPRKYAEGWSGWRFVPAGGNQKGQHIFACLHTAVQQRLARRFMESDRIPNKSDWINVRSNVEFDFSRSWSFRLVFAVVLLMSLLAIVQMLTIILNSIPLVSLYNLLLAAGAGVILLALSLMMGLGGHFQLSDAPYVIGFMGLGPITVIPRFIEVRTFNKARATKGLFFWLAQVTMCGVFASVMPIVLGFVMLALLNYLSLLHIGVIWTIVFLVCFPLWRYGRSRERLAKKNPLKGLL